MKIQDDLVYDKNTGALIADVDLQPCRIWTKHVLVFLVKSVMNPLSYSLATFSTYGITSYQMFPLLWRVVAILEVTCNLKVIATTSDGALQNRMFYKNVLSV